MTTPDDRPEAPLAPVERRFHAALADRVLAWAVLLAAAALSWRLWWSEGVLWPGVALVSTTVLVLWVVAAALLGTTGRSPGRALAGIHVVDAEHGKPIGVRRALVRVAVGALAGLPTGGLGLAILAWSAMEDPERRRRGLHDRLTGSVVLRTPDREGQDPPAAPVVASPPSQLVNLTALRLAPVAPEALVERSGPPAPPVGPSAVAPTPDPTLGRDQLSGPGTVLAGGTRAGTSAPRSATARWRLTADTGEQVEVSGLVLLGRNPEPRPGERAAHLLALRSEDMSLSKTHVAVQVARDGTPVAVDRGSTNGSVLLRRGVSRDLSSGRAVTLLPGDRIRLGDREVVVSREEIEAQAPNNGRSPQWQ